MSEQLTDAQRRAKDWLPPDGSWKQSAGGMAAALSSLSLAWPGCVTRKWRKAGPRGGTALWWRLTEVGVEKVKSF